MLKMAGLLLIVFAGTGLGFQKCLELSRREKALTEISRMVLFLKGEIRYGNASLHDALLGAAKKMPGEYGAFLRDTACMMEKERGKTFGEIFRMCAKAHMGELGLSGEEKEALFSLGEHLGYLDLDMQIRQLTLYEEELSRFIGALRGELPAKKKVYQSLGILGGILLAILVW